MLDEIIAFILSFFSSLPLDSLHFSREIPSANQDTSHELHQCHRRQIEIHTEYESFGHENFVSSAEYVQLGSELRVKPSKIHSLTRSLKVTVNMTSASLFLMLLATSLAYFDLRTYDLCSEWQLRNRTVSFDVMRFRLLGDVIEVVVLYLWFPLTLIILFGYSEFKRHYSTTILVGLNAGLLYSLYLSFLLLYRGYDSKLLYRVPGNVLFVIAVVWECAIVVRKIRKNHPTVSYSYSHVFTVVCFPLLFTSSMGMFYRCAIAEWFNAIENVLYRFILAVMTPALAIVPTAICRYLALWRTSEIIEPERSFVLVYFMRAAWITMYRIMQADFKSIWLFVGLSLLSGVSGLLKTATVGIREKIWSRVINLLRRTCCAKRLQQLPVNTPHHRRLKADIEIQNILLENDSLVISQLYIVFYIITSFVLSDWTAVVRKYSIRIAIALGIEFIFNTLSIFVQIHWYDIPIGRVWSRYWKRHLFANGIVFSMLVLYFTKVLLSVLQVRLHGSFDGSQYRIRNCTLPFDSWL